MTCFLKIFCRNFFLYSLIYFFICMIYNLYGTCVEGVNLWTMVRYIRKGYCYWSWNSYKIRTLEETKPTDRPTCMDIFIISGRLIDFFDIIVTNIFLKVNHFLCYSSWSFNGCRCRSIIPCFFLQARIRGLVVRKQQSFYIWGWVHLPKFLNFENFQ